MKVSVRAPLMAGIAAVGASAIAIAPVQVTRPEVTASANRPAATRVVSNARVEFLAAVQQTTPASAAVTAAPAPLNAASDFIINAWNAVLPWIDYGVNLADYVLGFIPYGYLIGDQINIVYYSLVRPVANSFVVDLVAPVVNDPLNPASYVDGLITVGSVTVNSLINLGINEFNYFFGWLVPPIPPLPLTTTATDAATTELTTAASMEASEVTTPIDSSRAEVASEDVATSGTVEAVVETATHEDAPPTADATEVEQEVAKDTKNSEDDATTESTPTTSSDGTVQAQGEVRGAAVDAVPDRKTTEAEGPSEVDRRSDEQDATETTAKSTNDGTEANPDKDDAGAA